MCQASTHETFTSIYLIFILKKKLTVLKKKNLKLSKLISFPKLLSLLNGRADIRTQILRFSIPYLFYIPQCSLTSLQGPEFGASPNYHLLEIRHSS